MNPYLGAVIENVLPVLVLILTPILSALLGWVLLKVKEKFGVDIGVARQKQLMEVVDNGIGAAEQWALNKAKLPEGAPEGAQKLDKALEFIADFTKQQGMQVKAKEELTKLVEARLGVAALEAAAAVPVAPAAPVEPVK